MLHQIRKMVALAIWAISTNQPEWVISASFLSTVSFKIFMVPGDFLLLRACHFDYFFKKRQTTLCEPISLDIFKQEREDFYKEFILCIMVQKIKDGVFSDWKQSFKEKFFEMDCLLSESIKKQTESLVLEEKRRKDRAISRKRGRLI